MALKVYFGGAELVEAVNIVLDLGTDSTSFMTFELPLFMKDSWIEHQYEDIECYETATLKFQGFVEVIDPAKDRVIIQCRDRSGELERNLQSQDNLIGTDFILYEGKVKTSPAGTDLVIESNEGTTPDWVANEYVDQYLIISKQDETITTEEFQNGANDWVGHAGTVSNWTATAGDYTDVTKTPGTDFYHITINEALGTGTIRISLNAASYEINKDFPLKRLKVQWSAIALVAAKSLLYALFTKNVTLRFYLGATDNIAAANLIWSRTYGRDTWVEKSYSFGSDLWLDIPLSDQERYFTKGASYWEGGYAWITFDIQGFTIRSITEDQLKWYGLDVELEYLDDYYLETNDIITANNTTGTVTCDDSEGDPVNFNTRKVSEGDALMIALSLNSVFALVGQGLVTPPSTVPLSYPTFTEGYGKRLNGIDSYQLWNELCKHKDLIWYLDYRAASPTLTAKGTSDLVEETATLTGFRDWQVTVEDQSYSQVVIYWTGGFVTRSTGNLTSPLTYKEIRKDLVAESEAIAYADLLALKYADPAYAITLTYDSFIDVQPGYYVASITVDGVAYTNQLVRRVQYSHDSGAGPFETKIYLGRAFTPAEEHIGRTIGLIQRRQDMNDIIASSATYSPETSTRHSNLNGILPSSASQYHLTQAELTKLTGIEASANNYVHPNHSGDVTSVADGATSIVNKRTATISAPIYSDQTISVIAAAAPTINLKNDDGTAITAIETDSLDTNSTTGKTKLATSYAVSQAISGGAAYLPVTGGTMSGAIAMGTNKITGLANPTAAQDAAPKAYVDSLAFPERILLQKVASQAFTTSWQALTWETPTLDTTMFSAAANTRVTINTAGTYKVLCHCMMETRAGEWYYSVKKSGTTIVEGSFYMSSAAYYPVIDFNFVYAFAASDYIIIEFNNNTGASRRIYASYSMLYVERVG